MLPLPPFALVLAASLQPTSIPRSKAVSTTSIPRRHFLGALSGISSALLCSTPLLVPSAVSAAALTERVDEQFGYRISYPSEWTDAGKPVKTHLHEILLSGASTGKGVKLGVTIDPVKIDSLEAFGDLEQVTKRVLSVEETRDGVSSVTLRANAAEASNPEAGSPSYYTITWVTVSSRGTKIYCCKYCICNRKLYVLQMQANLDVYDGDAAARDALSGVVGSFRVSST